MNNTIKKSLLAVLSFLLVLACGLGVMSYNPARAEVGPIISTEETAEANVTTEENSGLRFTATVNGTAYRALLGKYGDEKVDAGMLVVPTDIVTQAATDSKDFTFAGMAQVSALNDFTYHAMATNFKAKGEDYQFFITIANIAERNYARDYSARAFVKITASELETVDGVDNSAFVKEGDAYYAYAEFNTENARNVFEVSKNAVAGGDLGDSADIAKKFMDKIVDLKYDQATSSVVIANNNANYTSPFTVEKDGFGNYVVNGKGVNPLAMFYNGERKTEFTFTDTVNVATVNTLVSQGATYNEKGEIVLTGVDYANNFQGTHKLVSNSYVGFEGLYGLNTYIDIYYTGDNFPYVTFFADQVDGILNSYDKNGHDDLVNKVHTEEGLNRAGITFMCGGRTYSSDKANANQNSASTLYVFGPYRYDDNFYKAFGNANHNGLKHSTVDKTKEYKLTVGVIDDPKSGNIAIDYTLWSKNGEEYSTKVYSYVCYTYNTTVAKMKSVLGLGETDELKGKIILYAGIRGEGVNTTFSYSMPYTKNA